MPIEDRMLAWIEAALGMLVVSVLVGVGVQVVSGGQVMMDDGQVVGWAFVSFGSLVVGGVFVVGSLVMLPVMVVRNRQERRWREAEHEKFMDEMYGGRRVK